MPGDAAGLTLAAHARADHEVVLAGPDRRDQRGDARRVVGAVAVHEHHDVGIDRVDRCHQAGAAVAAAGVDHVGTGGKRLVPGPVGAAAIGNDDLIDHVARDRAHHIGNRFLLVQRGDGDGDLYDLLHG